MSLGNALWLTCEEKANWSDCVLAVLLTLQAVKFIALFVFVEGLCWLKREPAIVWS